MLPDKLLRHPEPSKYRSPVQECQHHCSKDILSSHVSNAAKYAGSPADRAAIIAWGVQTLTQQLGEDFCKGGSFSGEGSTFTSEGVRLPYSKFNDMRSTGFSVITDYTNDEPTPRVALSLEDSDGTIQVIPDRRFLSRLMRRNISDG